MGGKGNGAAGILTARNLRGHCRPDGQNFSA
jgi:hypothetical protein